MQNQEARIKRKAIGGGRGATEEIKEEIKGKEEKWRNQFQGSIVGSKVVKW